MKIQTVCYILFFTAFLMSEENKNAVFIDGIAAIAGEHIILKSDVAQLVNMTAVQQQLNPATDMDKLLLLQNEVLKTLVDQKIMLKMAELDSVEVSEKEIDAALDQQIMSFVSQAGTEERAEEMLGQSLKSFRREFWYDMQDRLITDRYQQSLIQKITVTRQDVNTFFTTYKDSLPLFPTIIKLRHILIPIKAGKKSNDETRNTLNRLRSQIINKEETMEKIASLYSQDPGSKGKGGSLGFVRRGTLVPEFETVAFSQKVGNVSNVVETQFGFHIIKTEEKRGDRVLVRHILIVPEISVEDESRAYHFAVSLKDSADTLEKFKRLASFHSTDTETKELGGDLGWINPLNSPIPEIAKIIGLLDVGECSLPVRTTQGYHLFWIDKVRKGGKPNLQTHWSEIENMALNNKRMQWYDTWIYEARNSFYIHKNTW